MSYSFDSNGALAGEGRTPNTVRCKIKRTVFAIDPALRRPGLAALVNDELFACGSIRMPDRVNDLDIGIRIDEVARACVDWWVDTKYAIASHFACGVGEQPLAEPIVCYEKPQIYGGPRVEDPNDVMHIGMVASAVWARMRGGNERHTTVLTPTPREWTMNTSKSKTGDPWASQRGGLLARRLSPAERALVPSNHDAIDAACLALFAIGRLKAIRVNARPNGVRPQ